MTLITLTTGAAAGIRHREGAASRAARRPVGGRGVSELSSSSTDSFVKNALEFHMVIAHFSNVCQGKKEKRALKSHRTSDAGLYVTYELGLPMSVLPY